MELTKLKGNSFSWCACCAETVSAGRELIKISAYGSTRYVLASHLVSWAANSGDGEKLFLTKKPESKYPRPAPELIVTPEESLKREAARGEP